MLNFRCPFGLSVHEILLNTHQPVNLVLLRALSPAKYKIRTPRKMPLQVLSHEVRGDGVCIVYFSPLTFLKGDYLSRLPPGQASRKDTVFNKKLGRRRRQPYRPSDVLPLSRRRCKVAASIPSTHLALALQAPAVQRRLRFRHGGRAAVGDREVIGPKTI